MEHSLQRLLITCIISKLKDPDNISKGEVTNNSKSQAIDLFFKIKKEDTNITENKNNNIVQKYLTNIDDTFLDINLFCFPNIE